MRTFCIDWGKWSKICLMKKIWKDWCTIGATIEYYLVFLEPRYFSSMLPSMPKGKIVSVNPNGTTLAKYLEFWRASTCCIHDYVCHLCQHNTKSLKTSRVVGCDIYFLAISLVTFKQKKA